MALRIEDDAVTARLKHREESRQALLEKQRIKKERNTVQEETSQYFTEEFGRKKLLVESMLIAAANLPKEELQAHFQGVSDELQSLQKYLTDSTLFLPVYDISRAQQLFSQLQQMVSTTRDKFLPRKSFAFKSRKKVLVTEDRKAEETKGRNEDKCVEEKILCPKVTSAIEVKNRNSQKINIEADDVAGRDISVTTVSSCEVTIKGSPGTVYISDTQNSRIFCGPVSGAIFIDKCTNCDFTVACQQLRVHKTNCSLFKLLVTSHPIIEDCHDLQFGTYNWSYPKLAQHIQLAGLSLDVNNYDKVDDFNWLSSKEHSPNWSIIPTSID